MFPHIVSTPVVFPLILLPDFFFGFSKLNKCLLPFFFLPTLIVKFEIATGRRFYFVVLFCAVSSEPCDA